MLKKRRIPILIVLPVVLLVLAITALSLIPGKNPGRSVLSQMLQRQLPRVTVSELFFETGRNRMFAYAPADAAVASVGTLGLQVLGPDGSELLLESYRMTTPALVQKGNRFLAFDIGGTSIRVFTASRMITAFETDSPVVSASVNNNGWFCIVTQEQRGGARGTVTVYDGGGTKVYEATIGSCYALSAKLYDDNTTLVILGIEQNGSRIIVFDFDGAESIIDDPDRSIILGNETYFEFDFITAESVLAIGENTALIVNLPAEADPAVLCSYSEKRLGGYTYTDEFVALHLYDYNIGYSGQVLTFDYEGNCLGEFETSREITSIASQGDTLTILTAGGITFFNKYLETYPIPGNSAAAATAGQVIALGSDMALAANDLTALVILLEPDQTGNEKE